MKQYILSAIIGIAFISFNSCSDDFLTVQPSASQEAGGPATKKAIESNLASAYQILLMDSYADGNYNSYTLMGDLRSDDLWKGGGDANDQGSLFYLSQFRNTPSDVPNGWWKIYYSGLERANNAIIACENAVSTSKEDVDRLSAEAHFLRAYFIHNLWKMWGNIPYYESLPTAPYMAKQYKADDIYKEILEDLDFAIEGDKMPAQANVATFGHATKAAAQMLRARVVMYQNDQTRYNQVLADMIEVVNNPAYGLMDNLEEVFLNSGEFCKESIFETNQKADGRDWGSAWNGFGTNLPAFIAPSNLVDPDHIFIGGWGFAPVREEAYNMYAPSDKRRDASINDWRAQSYAKRFQDTGLFLRKYAARTGYNQAVTGAVDLNFDNNLRIFRLPEAYLNAAELIVGGATAPGAQPAQFYLDVVRKRAFGDAFDSNKVTATLENIKKERRLEFLGEGLRYWDLVRWGDASTVLSEDIPAFSSNRSWNPTTDKYLPISQKDIDNTKGTGEYELQQNPY